MNKALMCHAASRAPTIQRHVVLGLLEAGRVAAALVPVDDDVVWHWDAAVLQDRMIQQLLCTRVTAASLHNIDAAFQKAASTL